jgi:hypothetical protein
MKILSLALIAIIPFQFALAQKVDTSITSRVLVIEEHDSHYVDPQDLWSYAQKDTTLIWEQLKSSDIVYFKEDLIRFKEFLQYETHFSNILDNYVLFQVAQVALPTKSLIPDTGYFHSTVFEIQFYYPYQCDKFMQVVNKYKVEEWGYPTEEGGPILFYARGHSIFVFVDESDFGEWDLEKLKMVRDRVKKLLN